MRTRNILPVLAMALVSTIACREEAPGGGAEHVLDEISLVLAGQALIKVDPRLSWADPFGTITPIVQSADVAFTNFEMAIGRSNDRCNLPADYVTVLGEPALAPAQRPGNVRRPHAVEPAVMEFLASAGFNLMSVANNHIWDLGNCGVAATQAAAVAHGVVVAGAGASLDEATSPAYLDVGDMRVGLVAAATTRDERELVSGSVNGVWTGHQEDWDRNIVAVAEAARHADLVLFYHHFQIEDHDFDGLEVGAVNRHGHMKVEDVRRWQDRFARAVIDAGASMYVAHGDRAFDGVEFYRGRPIFRQLGGLAYQGLNPRIGSYEEHRPWWGILARLRVGKDGVIRSFETIPLVLDEGGDYVDEFSAEEFLGRRGFAEVATGSIAQEILARFQALSEHYGSLTTVRGERAFVHVPPLD